MIFMALYDKKLNIEKPNGVIQKANLYTDKADVGPDYLTIESGNDIVYAILAGFLPAPLSLSSWEAAHPE